MDTSKANILLIASALSTLSDSIFTLVLADVAREVTYDAYGANEEQAQRYLAAHYLTIIKDSAALGTGSAGSLTRIKTGDVENEFGSSGFGTLPDYSRFDTTSFGRVFMSIKKRSIVRARVFTV